MPDIFETTDAPASAATAYVLTVGQTAQGQLATGADRDFFAVSLVAGQTYSFAMTGTGINNVVNPYLRLYASNGTTLRAQNDDGLPGNNSIITYTPSTSGTYYLSAGSSANASAGQYGLSFSLGSKASFDTQMGAGVIDADLSWSAAPGTGATVSYGFRQNAAGYSVPGHDIGAFSQLTAEQIAAVEAILQVYAELCGLTFVRVNPSGYTNNATILFANYDDPSDPAAAFAYYPGSTASSSQDGDVWLNIDALSTTELPAGSFSHAVVAHEIGHALGLSHPGTYDAAGGGTITYADDAQFIQDSEQYSVMSYFAGTDTGAGDYDSHPDTPMLFDIFALQQIYGTNPATRAGNTIYGFNSTAGALFDFTQNTAPAFCIWDGGGIDTLDCSGFVQNQTVDLTEGGFSSVGGIAANISIALGAVIENAIGGAGDDTLVGNGVANTLDGGAGADTMAGGSQNDVYFVDDAGDAIVELSGQGYDTVNTGLASHTLAANVERVNFTGAGDFVGIGNGLANRFQGGAGNDRFVDTFGGADIFSGGAGTDVVDFRGSASGAIIDLATGVHGGAAAGDTYAGIERYWGSNVAGDTMTGDGAKNSFYGFGGDDALSGGAHSDRLEGGVGSDTLSGGADKDILNGGADNDILTGEGGADYFEFSAAGFGADTVTDFVDGVDKLKFFNGVADSIADFAITGNGTADVVLALLAAPENTVTLNGLAAITITAADFVFY
jgi:serralysin